MRFADLLAERDEARARASAAEARAADAVVTADRRVAEATAVARDALVVAADALATTRAALDRAEEAMVRWPDPVNVPPEDTETLRELHDSCGRPDYALDFGRHPPKEPALP